MFLPRIQGEGLSNRKKQNPKDNKDSSKNKGGKHG